MNHKRPETSVVKIIYRFLFNMHKTKPESKQKDIENMQTKTNVLLNIRFKILD